MSGKAVNWENERSISNDAVFLASLEKKMAHLSAHAREIGTDQCMCAHDRAFLPPFRAQESVCALSPENTGSACFGERGRSCANARGHTDAHASAGAPVRAETQARARDMVGLSRNVWNRGREASGKGFTGRRRATMYDWTEFERTEHNRDETRRRRYDQRRSVAHSWA